MALTMRISSNGQVSIPAEVRRRWGASEVLVTDLGDRLVVTPVPPREALRGKYRRTLPATDTLRADDRRADERRQRQRP